jgi:RNA polymerase sigma-70 factor (ECF subfamily)
MIAGSPPTPPPSARAQAAAIMTGVVFLTEYRREPARLLRLLRRSAAADRDAFTRLYQALAPDVHATVRAVLDGDRAHEVAAAAFLEAWHSADSHTAPGTDVAGWIIGIAARRAEEQGDPRVGAHPSYDAHTHGDTLAGLLQRRSLRRSPFRRG